MKQWLIGGALVLGLTGCASQAIDRMNSGLDFAMRQNVSHLIDALGQPAETSDDGDRTRYRWFKESHIEPCNVDALGRKNYGTVERPRVGIIKFCAP